MFLAVLTLGLACSGWAMAQSKGDAVAEAAPAAPHAFDYRLGAGDKLRIIVFGEESLTGEFFVSGSGKIAFPLIGDIDVLGKTIPEIQSTIETKLRDGYLKEPRVSAEVLNYRPFYILGEVMKPGEYPYTNGLTVLNAVATASGFTYRADTHKVYIRRAATKDEMPEALTPTTPVEPGDTIRIGERFF
jgi:polysaccharide export outer membrane protein